jgi:hypothetical protein
MLTPKVVDLGWHKITQGWLNGGTHYGSVCITNYTFGVLSLLYYGKTDHWGPKVDGF